VRRHFGYTIDPRDERFKELLDQKEKEQRKAMKESKRAVKEKKMMEKLLDDPKNKNQAKPETVDDDNEEQDDVKK
jgi:Growth arrest and DNA-damage-inducible proteins-interacting protein 1